MASASVACEKALLLLGRPAACSLRLLGGTRPRPRVAGGYGFLACTRVERPQQHRSFRPDHLGNLRAFSDGGAHADPSSSEDVAEDADRRRIRKRQQAPRSLARYSVVILKPDGVRTSTSLHLPDILRGSTSMHARDVFSLHLTTEERSRRDKREMTASTAGGGPKNPIYGRKSAPAILPRGEKVLVSFGHVKAAIGREEGMLFEAHRPSIKYLGVELSETFYDKYREARESDNVASGPSPGSKDTNKGDDEDNDEVEYIGDPFELVFLEEILRDVCDTWVGRIRLYVPVVESIMSVVRRDVYDYGVVHQLFPLKDSLQSFESEVTQALGCLEDLLRNDEDMLGLLLTEQATAKMEGKDIDLEKHEGVELMLEEYARQLSSLLQQINSLLSKVESKHELVALSLDGYRNRLMRMNVYLTVANVSLTTCMTTSAFYGMNLINGYEEHPTAFATVVFASCVTGAAISALCLHYMSMSRMRDNAIRRQAEVETLSGALGDMSAFDFVFKSIMDGETVSKDVFQKKLNEARIGAPIVDEDLDYIFRMLDQSEDGVLHRSDFYAIQRQAAKRLNQDMEAMLLQREEAIGHGPGKD